MQKKMKKVAGSSRTLRVQKLEDRVTLDGGGISQLGTVLSITGTNKGDLIQVDQVQGSNTVNVSFNGKQSTYNTVGTLVINGRNGDDDIAVNTYDDPGFLIDSFIFGGNGDDILQGGGGSDYLDGGNGDDVVSNFVTDENYVPIGAGSIDVLIGGNGDDSLWGGWGVQDIIMGGNGNDLIYDIVGGSSIIDGGRGDDFIINRGGAGLATDVLNNPGVLTSDILISDKRDSSVVRFDAATQANGPVLIGTTLYVLNLGGGDIQIDQVGDNLAVNYNGQLFSFASDDVNTIAGIGSGNDDSFVNNTDKKDVFYGQGGNDLLQGGSDRSVLKGGSGSDTIDGRGGMDDITGDAGSDNLFAQDGKKDVVRVDALDSFFTDIGKDKIVTKTNLAFS